LQELLQAGGWPLPLYELTASHGEDHDKTFDVRCAIGEPLAISVQSSAGSRRAAEQDAAEAVLAQLHAAKHPAK
jgi:ribonuclease III